MLARAGHRVVGVDLSAVGIAQMLAVGRREKLDLTGVVGDIALYEPDGRFDLVLLDRVLSMLPEDARVAALARALAAVDGDGHLLVADEPRGLASVQAVLAMMNWSVTAVARNFLIVQRT